VYRPPYPVIPKEQIYAFRAACLSPLFPSGCPREVSPGKPKVTPIISSTDAAFTKTWCFLADERIGVEVDGPHHYCHNTRAPRGEYIARQRLLQALDWALISVPCHHWHSADGGQRAAMLQEVRDDPHFQMIMRKSRRATPVAAPWES
jgi:hypothetical protein